MGDPGRRDFPAAPTALAATVLLPAGLLSALAGSRCSAPLGKDGLARNREASA